MSPRFIGWAGAVLMALTGCATTEPVVPPEPVAATPADSFFLSGRFSLKQGQQAAHGRFEWQHDRQEDKILLSGPLGQGVAQFDCQPGECRVEDAKGEVRRSPTSAELMKSLVGVAFPLEQVVGWLQGRSDGAERVERDGEGRLIKLWRTGWRIDYEYEGASRRPWLLMVNDGGDIELRLRLESWLDEAEPEAAVDKKAEKTGERTPEN